MNKLRVLKSLRVLMWLQTCHTSALYLLEPISYVNGKVPQAVGATFIFKCRTVSVTLPGPVCINLKFSSLN